MEIQSKLRYIVYSHTDYLDILTVQTEYLHSYKNKILLINRTDLDISDICSEYAHVIYYDDYLPYASRLLKLSELEDKYILLIHDIDILVNRDDRILSSFINYMDQNNIDRIDLQVRHTWDVTALKDSFNDIVLSKQDRPDKYIYNVNPSIWNLASLLDVMNTFKNETYRTIESIPIQLYCMKLKIYKLYSNEYISCGWFSCLKFFQFIHITHYGKLLPKINNKLDHSLSHYYFDIVEKILKKNKNRPFAEKI